MRNLNSENRRTVENLLPLSPKSLRWTNVLAAIVLLLFSLVFLYLSVHSLSETSVFDSAENLHEHILFQRDSVPLNIGMLVLLFSLCVTGVILFGNRLRDRHVKIAAAVLFCWSFALSLAWSLSVLVIPLADSRAILRAADLASQNDYSFFQWDLPYFQMFPFQLGLVSVYEVADRLFRSHASLLLYALNAVSVVAADWALIQISKQLFRDLRVTLLTIVLLGFCFQPMFFACFLYGNLPALAALLWACVLLIRFLRTGSWLDILWIALLCAGSVLVKQNSWIAVVAICVSLTISLVNRFRVSKLTCFAAVLLAPMLLTSGVKELYGVRAGFDIGSGTPQTAWFVMGLSEADAAPGWFNGYTYSLLPDAGMDAARAKEVASIDLQNRIDALKLNPAYTRNFFQNKILSQWNEPSFGSIFVSKACDHYNDPPAYVWSIYDGDLSRVFAFVFEHQVTLTYVLSLLGVLILFFSIVSRKKRTAVKIESQLPEVPLEGVVLLPLILLGAVLYHSLFEAKSQYSYIYIPMLQPFAAFAVVWASDSLRRVFQRRSHRVVSRS
jgi:hypothetical protein